MDGAIKTKRLFPAYTLAELEAFAAQGNASPAMLGEIEARKSGASKPFVVPQLKKGV
jgi:hypothetical protein